ncbi:hypothetical protein Tco_0965059 [Tanacetum coccineum]
MRVKRFIKKIERKLDLNGKETVGFDRTKLECYNFYRIGHFSRECKAPRNQGNRNRDDPRRNAPVDTSTTNALVVQDGIGGYDWSFQAEKGITNFALIAYASQGSSSSDSKSNKSKDKTGLGYDSKMNESELNNIHMNESEVVHSVFNSRESDVDDSSVNDRFKNKVKGFMQFPLPTLGTTCPQDLTYLLLTVATKSGQVPVNAATSPNSPRAAASISTARPVNTAAPKPKVNIARVNNVTTARPKAVVSTAEGNRENVVKSSS